MIHSVAGLTHSTATLTVTSGSLAFGEENPLGAVFGLLFEPDSSEQRTVQT